jgi:hypothetical protein
MFSSKTPRDLNHDDAPWLGDPGHTNTPNRYGSREVGESAPFWDEVTYEPRPEFDHVQHNPPNWLLIEFREFHGVASLWLEALEVPDFITETAKAYGEEIHTEHVDHATRVLTRLAHLSGGES